MYLVTNTHKNPSTPHYTYKSVLTSPCQCIYQAPNYRSSSSSTKLIYCISGTNVQNYTNTELNEGVWQCPIHMLIMWSYMNAKNVWWDYILTGSIFRIKSSGKQPFILFHWDMNLINVIGLTPCMYKLIISFVNFIDLTHLGVQFNQLHYSNFNSIKASHNITVSYLKRTGLSCRDSMAWHNMEDISGESPVKDLQSSTTRQWKVQKDSSMMQNYVWDCNKSLCVSMVYEKQIHWPTQVTRLHAKQFQIIFISYDRFLADESEVDV